MPDDAYADGIVGVALNGIRTGRDALVSTPTPISPNAGATPREPSVASSIRRRDARACAFGMQKSGAALPIFRFPYIWYNPNERYPLQGRRNHNLY